jgi:hypothetical protein
VAVDEIGKEALSERKDSAPQPLSCISAHALEEFRVVGNVFDPKLTHNSLYVIRLEATPIRRGATKLAQPHYS